LLFLAPAPAARPANGPLAGGISGVGAFRLVLVAVQGLFSF